MYSNMKNMLIFFSFNFSFYGKRWIFCGRYSKWFWNRNSIDKSITYCCWMTFYCFSWWWWNFIIKLTTRTSFHRRNKNYDNRCYGCFTWWQRFFWWNGSIFTSIYQSGKYWYLNCFFFTNQSILMNWILFHSHMENIIPQKFTKVFVFLDPIEFIFYCFLSSPHSTNLIINTSRYSLILVFIFLCKYELKI